MLALVLQVNKTILADNQNEFQNFILLSTNNSKNVFIIISVKKNVCFILLSMCL